MQEIAVSSEKWSLRLRWPERDHVPEAGEDTSSILIEAREAFQAVVPGAGQVGASAPPYRVEQSLTRPLFWEPKALEVAWEHDEGGLPLSLHHPDARIREALCDPSGRGRVLAGSLDLGDRVGFLDLEFRRERLPVVTVRLEIFPSKISFRSDFERMLSDLGSERIPQVLRLLERTSIARDLRPRPGLGLTERYRIFDAFFEKIDSALRQIARQPHSGLATVAVARPVERLRRPDERTRRAASRSGGRRVQVGALSLPARLPDGHREATFDTPANRFVARALRSLAGLLAVVRRHTGGAPPWNDPVLRELIDARQRTLRRWLDAPFLRDLPDRPEAPDLVVQRSPGYRDLLTWYRRTLLAFSVVAGNVRMGLADLWYVYQLWCAVRVEQEVARLIGDGEGTLVPLTAHRPSLQGGVRYPDGTVLTAQHRASDASEGAVHQPDLLLELRRPAPRGAGEVHFQLVLDAKYRLQWDKGKPLPPQDALNAIHRYRDAVLTPVGDPERKQRRVYGGVILFPHPGEDRYAADPTSAWHGFERMGVGAIPLVPGQGRLLRQWLGGLIHASAVRLDRLGPPYPALPPPSRAGTVLIAPLKYGQAQLAQMLEDGWYHLPAKFRLAAHHPTHLAPYERAQGGATARVRWLWRIVDWELVKGSRVSHEATFGGGRAGRSAQYWKITLGGRQEIAPAIEGYDWGPQGPMYVPLEVFDLAESVFLLRGDASHTEILRVLHHLRQGAATWREGWHVREPLVLNGRRLGWLNASAEGITWRTEQERGSLALEALQRRAVQDVFTTLREAVERAAAAPPRQP
ncbi:MAG: DUF2357 domain-containing protein [Pseudomonadota bacterium]